MQSKTLLYLIFCIFLCCSFKCKAPQEINDDSRAKKSDTIIAKKHEQPINKQSPPKEDFVKAIVKDFRGLDGCEFVLLLENGKQLIPSKLNSDYKIQDLPVLIKYKKAEGMMGICMAGEIVEIIDIKKDE